MGRIQCNSNRTRGKFGAAGYIDVVYDVSNSSGTTEYLFRSSVDPYTGYSEWNRFRLSLGYSTGSNFVPSTNADSLDFDAPDYDAQMWDTQFPSASAVLTKAADTVEWEFDHPSGFSTYYARPIDVPDSLDAFHPDSLNQFTVRLEPIVSQAGTIVLDQENDPGPTILGGGSITQSAHAAQTFTVGVSGTLAKIDLLLSADSGSLFFDLIPTQGGSPLEDQMAALLSMELDASQFPARPPKGTSPGFTTIDVSFFGIEVVQGEKLAIVLRGLDSTSRFDYFLGNPYPLGEYFRRSPPGTWLSEPSRDMGFRTFVQLGVVPETSTFLIWSLLAGLGVFWRRRR